MQNDNIMTKETKLGLTIGQIISILGLLIIVLGGYVSLYSRITALEVQMRDVETKGEYYKTEVRDLRLEMKKDLYETKCEIKKDLTYIIEKMNRR